MPPFCYHDSALSGRDVGLLDTKGVMGGWVNDSIIQFCFEYFEYDEFANLSNRVIFMHPSMVHLLQITGGGSF